MLNTMDKIKIIPVTGKKRTTKNEITRIIREDMADDQENIEIFTKVRDILADYEGKTITKRLANAVAKKFPKMHVHWDKDISWCKGFRMWDKTVRYNERKEYRFSLGDDTFSLNYFDKHNRAYGSAANERNQKNILFLSHDSKVEQLADAIDAFNEAKEHLDAISPDSLDLPAIYQINKLWEHQR